MSISGISDSTNSYQNNMSQLQSVGQDFSGLSTSLASGDLTAAQNAFATLLQDLGNTNVQASQQTGASSQISTDLTTLSSALSSNNLAASQKAYATLLQDMNAAQQTQATHHHHHHHHHAGNAQSTTDAVNNDFSSLGTALQSGDLTAAQKAFAALMQDIGNSGTQNASVTASTSAQSTAASQGSATSSLVDALQTTNSTSQNGSTSSVNTLLQALNLYAGLGQSILSVQTAGLFSAIG